jgi:hypothetical protein
VSTVSIPGSSLATGDGWYAEIQLSSMYLSVSPVGDMLPDALETLLSPTQRMFWTIQWSYEDEAGWDVYLLHRLSPTLVTW